jgi:hypothetical protein
MTTQMLETPTEIYNLLTDPSFSTMGMAHRVRPTFSLPLIINRPQIGFTPKDFGYEIDEEEIAREMLLQNSNISQGSDIPEVAPEDFEATFGYFLS